MDDWLNAFSGVGASDRPLGPFSRATCLGGFEAIYTMVEAKDETIHRYIDYIDISSLRLANRYSHDVSIHGCVRGDRLPEDVHGRRGDSRRGNGGGRGCGRGRGRESIHHENIDLSIEEMKYRYNQCIYVSFNL